MTATADPLSQVEAAPRPRTPVTALSHNAKLVDDVGVDMPDDLYEALTDIDGVGDARAEEILVAVADHQHDDIDVEAALSALDDLVLEATSQGTTAASGLARRDRARELADDIRRMLGEDEEYAA